MKYIWSLSDVGNCHVRKDIPKLQSIEPLVFIRLRGKISWPQRVWTWVDIPRTNGVDSDVIADKFVSQCSAPREYCSLGEAVPRSSFSRYRPMRSNRCNHDNASAVTLLFHMPSCKLCCVEGATDLKKAADQSMSSSQSCRLKRMPVRDDFAYVYRQECGRVGWSMVEERFIFGDPGRRDAD